MNEFNGKDEFSLNIIEAFEHSFGAIGLWMTIRHIFMDLVDHNEDYVIIAEDDIVFTETYSLEYLMNSINEANKKEADILLGGVSWFSNSLQLSDNVFWVDNFSGLHFTVVFKNFFKKLSSSSIICYNAADDFIASISTKILFIHPFIAVQKDFGYSDATANNNSKGRIEALFNNVNRRLKLLDTVRTSCQLLKKAGTEITEELYENITIPTYIINLPERNERRAHIIEQFADKSEFDITIVEACKNPIGALGLWLSIRKVINIAIMNDDDVIIICEDDHEFTPHYSKKYLLQNILEAYNEGAAFLSGGTGKFYDAIPITKNRFWVNHCLSTQFIVVYKTFFKQILDQPFDEKIVADMAYSELGVNKMFIYPFVSTQKDFGYSDITDAHNENKNCVTDMFNQSSDKLKLIQETYAKYLSDLS